MNHTAQIPPRTIMEVYKMLPEGTLAEIIDGTLSMSPSPNTNHQSLLSEIHFFVRLHIEKSKRGKVFFAPYDVYLDDQSNVVQPDIIYLDENNAELIREDGIHGAPDLVIEVLSPNNRKHDMLVKKALYEKFGVKEYWIIDPDTKECTGYFLKGGMYSSLGTSRARFKSLLLNSEFAF